MTEKYRIVPLVNFQSSLQHFDFGSGVALDPLTEPEAKVLGSPYFIGETSHSNRPHTQFKLLLVRDGPLATARVQASGPHDHPVNEPLFNVTVALRLLKPGDFGVPIYIEFEPGKELEWEAGGFWGQAKRLGTTFEFNDADAKTVSRLVVDVEGARARQDRRLDLALLRFGDTYGRNRAEDALVDGQIALESCLTPDSTVEVSYRLALRGAALLAGQYPPTETRLLLSLAYDARSKLVHRGWSLGNCFKDRKFATMVGRYEKMSGYKLAPENFAEHSLRVVRTILRTTVQMLSTSIPSINDLVAAIDDRIGAAIERDETLFAVDP